MEQIQHNPKLREKTSASFDNDVSLGLSGTHNSIGYRIAEIEKHFHNSEKIYGQNTWMTEDLPVKFTVIGGDNAWGTEYMLTTGATIESGLASKYFDLNTLYIVSVSAANEISIMEFLTGTSGPAITPVAIDETGGTVEDMFTFAGHGLINGDKIIFNSVTTTTGLSANIVYYVRGMVGNYFQVSLTLGGTAVAVTNDGTCSISKLTQTSLTKACISMAAVNSDSMPYPLISPRRTCNNKIFVRAKSQTGSTVSIGYLLGLHTYQG